MKRGKWLGKLALMLLAIAAIGMFGFGCVSGLQPVGWSGGAIDGNTLLVGSAEGRLVSVNLADESRQWSVELKAAPQGGFGCSSISPGGGCAGGTPKVAIYGTPVVAGDLAYIGGYNGKVYAYNKDTLELRWVYPREEFLAPIVGGLAVADGILYFGGSDGRLYALDAATGDKVAEFATGDKIWATPVASGGLVYVGSFDKKFYALDAATLEMAWSFDTQGAIITAAAVGEDAVYFGSFDRSFYALNVADGTLKWQDAGVNWYWATPLLHEGVVYAPNMDSHLYLYDAASGEQLVSLEVDSPLASAPAYNEDSVIFASRNGIIYSVSTLNNALRELNDIEQDVYGPLTVKDGIIYVHTADLTLHRVNAANGAVLRSISLESPD